MLRKVPMKTPTKKMTTKAQPRGSQSETFVGLTGLHRPAFIKDEVLADIFSASVKRNPKAIAIIEREERLTYAEVDQRSDQIAAELIARGAGPGQVIGLYFTRGANLLLAQISCYQNRGYMAAL